MRIQLAGYPSLYYAGTPADGFGWGTCNKYMKRHLAEYFNLVDPWERPDVVFMPLADHDFNPISAARGRFNFAYTFFESDLGPNAAKNSSFYDVVFCGSHWCVERLHAMGIKNARVLHQGVDFDIFRPAFRDPDAKIRVFSGGKFEWRKGQDLVIAAMAEFMEENQHVELVCAWHNPWPALVNDMFTRRAACLMSMPDLPVYSQEDIFRGLIAANGINPERVAIHPQLSHAKMSEVMAQTDVGLFPNRCEGGTNLVLMEYLSCHRPAIATIGTGHRDLLGCCIKPLSAPTNKVTGWVEPSVSSILASLRTWWHCAGGCDRDRIFNFSWDRTAETVLRAFLELDS